jgi:hypothetical protein
VAVVDPVNRARFGRNRVEQLKLKGKSFEISKWEVWEAYLKVKENRGAPGVDGQSLDEFETDLKNNLYRIWNRMSSGTWFPPPVRAVEIPNRTDQAPECSAYLLSRTGWRRRWWPEGWKRGSNRSSTRIPTAIAQDVLRWMRWRYADGVAGHRTG